MQGLPRHFHHFNSEAHLEEPKPQNAFWETMLSAKMVAHEMKTLLHIRIAVYLMKTLLHQNYCSL